MDKYSIIFQTKPVISHYEKYEVETNDLQEDIRRY
jgi:hypothetical protein